MTYDYIVVGGGSSGCAVASRLAEDRDIKVLLLEAGGLDSDPFIHLPVGFYRHSDGPLTWGFETEQEPAAKNRRMNLPQARVLGGGSSINAMVYVRGTPEDFDTWARDEQCKGWSFRDVEPFFLRTEGNETFSGKHHGADGPLRVSDAVNLLPLTRAFLRACQEFGMTYNPDFTGGHLEGCGPYQRTVSNGRRCSAVTAFLKADAPRDNLTVKTNCLVHKIIIENNSAVGVRVDMNGTVQDIRAEREVILAAGAINSPKILMLSGVGESDHLAEIGVPVVHELRGVGKNLQEHALLGTTWQLGGAYSYDRYKKPLNRFMPALQYYLFKSGPVTTNIAEAGGFWTSDDSESVPDIQFFLLLGSVESKDAPPIRDGVTMSTYPCRPRSRGTVRLRSNVPGDKPRINFNFYSDPYDMERQVSGLKLCQEVMSQNALKPFGVRPHMPSRFMTSQSELIEFVKSNAYPGSHPVGTCKMGLDERSVVDPQLRVHGIDRLRICDASVMPRLISTNTNATAIMIGERCAHFIKGNSADAVA